MRPKGAARRQHWVNQELSLTKCLPSYPSQRTLIGTAGMSQTVESRMGAVAWGQWPTLRFPSPLIEPDVPISGIRLSDWLHREAHGGARQGQAFETQQAAFSIDNVEGEPVGAAPCHFVPSGEEVAHALIDVAVNAAECRPTRPVAEVVRPAAQRPVQRVAHFRPWIVVAGHQQIAAPSS